MTTIPFPETAGTTQETQTQRILICIPSYNEEKSIGEIISKAKAFATEVIVYDDGSIDNTVEVAKKNGAIVLRNSRNKGYGKALKILFKYAKLNNADIVVTLDSDGQHDANQIPRLLEPLLRGEADIVIGSRFINKINEQNVPLYRKFGIKAITKVTQLACGNKITDAQSGFRAYNNDALSKLQLSENGMAASTEILLDADFCDLKILEVPITVRYDVEDSSTHNPLVHGMKVFTHVAQFLSFKHPLLSYGFPGLVLLLISGYFLYNAVDLFSSTRYVSTNLIVISIGFSLIGIVLLATAAIIYTIISLFKSKLKNM
jgi:glycosyltransferase involved in cell wall biosynthesis